MGSIATVFPIREWVFKHDGRDTTLITFGEVDDYQTDPWQMLVDWKLGIRLERTAQELAAKGKELAEALERVKELEGCLDDGWEMSIKKQIRRTLRERVRADTAETKLEAEAGKVERLRGALESVRNRKNQVCENYETCDCVGCKASYEAFAIADAALNTVDSREAGEG